MFRFVTPRVVAFAVTLFCLSACGGSGGTSPMMTPPPPPPPPLPAGGGGGPMPFPAAPDDAQFANLWHLLNTAQGGGLAGEDCRATQVWATAAGNDPDANPTAGIVCAVLDDGLEIAHEDLAPNVATSLHSNFSGGTDPSPPTDQGDQSHGTSVGGVIAARGNNATGVTGVAPYAQLVGRRVLGPNGTGASDAELQAALTADIAQIHIVNSSFGPNDDNMYYPVSMADWDAYITGINSGRSGRGAIYLRAAGNGGGVSDFANLDELNSHYAVLAITSVGNNGLAPAYAERGSSILVAGHSDGGTLGITTTDQTGLPGSDASNYTSQFGGTSSATPLVAGVVALMLSTNANLGWRDVRRILAQSARQVNAADAAWATNGVGMNIHPLYGFGAVDAVAATTLATGWTNLPTLSEHQSPVDTVNLQVPEDGGVTGITRMITVAAGDLPLNELDHVIVTMNITTADIRQLNVTLTSPLGTVSELLVENPGATAPTPGGEIRLGSTRCMREDPTGVWTLTVRDTNMAANPCAFADWGLLLFGH